ncbi:hypothetical protein [Dyadobacter sandarakinus]|uniref:Uncharacterized protein n=1 Tax=Dyadobacter sandarakinus TaxID=2747268 RepID=A0ABX7I6Y9_9BACT|nr:hypothetical protein [Dyadobacter sandarakinus]QRR01871.1 hypothetical protein HWI92_13605 [Dyadobacter sandarakinus]
MKSFHVKAVKESDEEMVTAILRGLQKKGWIVLADDEAHTPSEELTPATEEQVQEIIDEAELGPFYSEKEAKNILNL